LVEGLSQTTARVEITFRRAGSWCAVFAELQSWNGPDPLSPVKGVFLAPAWLWRSPIDATVVACLPFVSVRVIGR